MQSRLKRALVAGIAAAGFATVGSLAVAQVVQAKPSPAAPPAITTNQEAKPAVLPGTVDAKSMAPRGATQLRQVDPTTGAPLGKSPSAVPNTGYNSNVDFSTQYNYCYGALTYTTVHNLSSATQYYEVVFYNGSQSRTFYSSLSAGAYGYPTFYGTNGSWTAYLYVWNGSAYSYDEYLTGSNTCSVTYSVTKSIYSGYLYFTATNNGTDYAYTELDELAPYAAYNTYTGDHWYYPAAGGGTVSQYVYVGVGIAYGVDVNPAAGSTYYPSHYTGSY